MKGLEQMLDDPKEGKVNKVRRSHELINRRSKTRLKENNDRLVNELIMRSSFISRSFPPMDQINR